MEIKVGKRYRELVRSSTFSSWKEPVGRLFIPVTVTKTTVRDDSGNWMRIKDFRESFGEEPEDVTAVKVRFKIAKDLMTMGVSDAEELVRFSSEEAIERLVMALDRVKTAKATFDRVIKGVRCG